MPHSVNSKRDFDSGLACLLLLARFYEVPAEGEQLRHEFGQSGQAFDEVTLLRVARHLGFNTKAVDSEWSRLSVINLPAIAQHNDGHYVLLARAGDGKVLVHDPLEPRALSLPKDIFEQAWSGRLILFTQRAGIGSDNRKFDFSWFIPAIVKHRKLLGEVLLASFFIQIFALLTPLFFQVVIDKVLVHKGMTTLHVLAIGMLALIVFDVILNGLRTYVFAHTSSRIDVGLGSQLFRHLLRLPIAWFEERRVGETVARVRELESIREFLTSSTVTLVIDLFFTLVFFAVMYLYSPLLTLVVALTIPLYVILSIAITPVLLTRTLVRRHSGLQEGFRSRRGSQAMAAPCQEPQHRAEPFLKPLTY